MIIPFSEKISMEGKLRTSAKETFFCKWYGISDFKNYHNPLLFWNEDREIRKDCLICFIKASLVWIRKSDLFYPCVYSLCIWLSALFIIITWSDTSFSCSRSLCLQSSLGTRGKACRLTVHRRGHDSCRDGLPQVHMMVWTLTPNVPDSQFCALSTYFSIHQFVRELRRWRSGVPTNTSLSSCVLRGGSMLWSS